MLVINGVKVPTSLFQDCLRAANTVAELKSSGLVKESSLEEVVLRMNKYAEKHPRHILWHEITLGLVRTAYHAGIVCSE